MNPPRFSTWLLSRTIGDDGAATSVLGDLHEEWSAQRDANGLDAANTWYRREARTIALSWTWMRLTRIVRRAHRESMPSAPGGNDSGRELRYALRSLRRGWRFAAGVVLSLGLAVGLGVPVLGLADHFFLRTPPGIDDPDRVVRLVLRGKGQNGPHFTDGLTGLDYGAMVTQARAVSGVAAWMNISMSLGRGPEARPVNTTITSASFFSVLGVKPLLGRTFTDAEDVEGSTEAPCVVSHRFWLGTMNGTPDVLGKRFVIGSVIYTVVGVAPEGFNGMGLDAVDFWLPIHVAAPEFQGRDPKLWRTDNSAWLRIVARLRPGVSLEAATADVARVYRTSGPRIRDAKLEGTLLWDPLQPGRSSLPNRSARVALWLSAGGALLLVLVTANLVSLFLARAAAQRQQLAIRRAVGGGWRHLFRLHLLEAFILAACAALLGLAVSIPVVRVTRALIFPSVTWIRPEIDLRIAALAFAIAMVVGGIVAVWSSLQAARVDPADLLRGAASGRNTAGRHTHRVRQSLLVTQAAIFAILLAGSAAFVVSLRRASNMDVGFDMDRVIAASIPLASETPIPRVRDVYRRAHTRLAALPEVESVSLGYMEPWFNNAMMDVFVPGAESKPPLVMIDIATPDHLRTLGVSMRAGRWIDSTDRAGSTPVIVINEALERALWAAGTAIGRCIRIGADSMPCRTIVGVVRDFRVTGAMDGPFEPIFYLPFDQTPAFGQTPRVFFRARGDATAAERAVRRALQQLEPDLPAVNVRAVSRNVAWMTAPLRLGASAFTAFGALAAIVAAIGLYSVLSFLVVEQRRETAVRLALGAAPYALGWSIARRALLIVLGGMVIGFAALLPLSTILEPMLFHTRLLDAASLALVAAIGIVTALAGALVPMRSVLRADATAALRE
jgi:predicted permease